MHCDCFKHSQCSSELWDSQKCCFKPSAGRFTLCNCCGLKIWWKKVGRKKPYVCFVDLWHLGSAACFRNDTQAKLHLLFSLWAPRTNLNVEPPLTSHVKGDSPVCIWPGWLFPYCSVGNGLTFEVIISPVIQTCKKMYDSSWKTSTSNKFFISYLFWSLSDV